MLPLVNHTKRKNTTASQRLLLLLNIDFREPWISAPPAVELCPEEASYFLRAVPARPVQAPHRVGPNSTVKGCATQDRSTSLHMEVHKNPKGTKHTLTQHTDATHNELKPRWSSTPWNKAKGRDRNVLKVVIYLQNCHSR